MLRVPMERLDRPTLIDQIQQASDTLEKLLTLLQSTPVERAICFSSLSSEKGVPVSACDSSGKSGKQIERCLISSFQVAEGMGFNGEFGQWGTFCGLAISHCGCLGLTICHTDGVRPKHP
jgi:hypothetical protein